MILPGHGAREPDTITLVSCHTQATNSEFPVGQVYFDAHLNLEEIDVGVDVQDKIYSTSMHPAPYRHVQRKESIMRTSR
jgi:hypothetical protein